MPVFDIDFEKIDGTDLDAKAAAAEEASKMAP